MTEIIAALDVDSLAEAEGLVERLGPAVRLFKVGLRLYTAWGPRAVEAVRRRGGEVFLDLKLHDIPQTVADAVREAGKLGVRSLSLHLSGGGDMLRAAVAVEPRPELWGVTVLTSLSSSDLKIIHPEASVAVAVRRLAKMGLENGLDAVICSAEDVPALRKALKRDARFVTPGIRPSGTDAGDQKRFVTPADAARLG